MNAAGNAPIRPQGSPGRRLWLSGGSLFVALVSLWGAEPAVSPVEPTKPAEGTAGGSLLSSNSMQLVALGNQAVRDGKRSNALALFSRALEVNPTNTLALYNRARLNDSEGHYTNALADFTRLLAINPRHLGATQMRGSLHLRLGELDQAIADFDRYIELTPRAEQQHWQRGIAYYLSDRYQDAVRQFSLCQRHDTHDLENAIWHFISIAKTNGIEKARAVVPPFGKDRRPILNDICAVLEGRMKPEELIRKAEGSGEAGPESAQNRFAAHYYLGLYYDVSGDLKKSLDHLGQAAKLQSVDNIMNDMARLQIKLRSRSPSQAKP